MKLLAGWEDVAKKGQLTMWIMLALKDGPKHMNEIKEFILNMTDGVILADDQSMYRALRRFNDAELVNFTTEPGSGGPDLKVYGLTEIGSNVLQAYLKRNIQNVFYKPEIKNLIEREVD
jgi:PadR family transcriptional regulator PadR